MIVISVYDLYSVYATESTSSISCMTLAITTKINPLRFACSLVIELETSTNIFLSTNLDHFDELHNKT